ncbi:reverse transcriptase family protein [Pseudarthrobacter phenanthrenivorans]
MTGSTPVLSLGHLASLTGASANYLRTIVDRSHDPYIQFERPKRTGGTRIISAPEPILMEVQRWLLHNALCHIRTHPSSFAYLAGRSSIDCSQMHVGARWLIKMDLKNFFGTISEWEVYRILREANYSSLVSLEITRLMTRVHSGAGYRSPRTRNKYPVIRGYAVSNTGVLPQGGPASGMLANAVMREVDQRLSELAAAESLTYTRYSDDIAFSTPGKLTREASQSFIRKSSRIIENAGFLLQEKKTRVVPPGARHIVLGLLVDNDRVRLMPEFKKRVGSHISGVKRFGLVEHSQHRRFRSVLGFIRFVDGNLAHAAAVDPPWAAAMRTDWHEALEHSSFPIASDH